MFRESLACLGPGFWDFSFPGVGLWGFGFCGLGGCSALCWAIDDNKEA